jgi:acetyl-CoA C-acetyltransferase
MSRTVVIIAAKRTPQGRFLGALSRYSAEQLGTIAAKAALEGVDPGQVDLTIVGRVLPPDFNTARTVSRAAGVPVEKPAFTVNMACASGLKAVQLAADAIQLGQADLVLAGGLESMTNTPRFLNESRSGKKLGDAVLVDALMQGLSDVHLNLPMGITAENLAAKYDVKRAAADAFALSSHRKAVAAQQSGALDAELVTLPELDRDEHPRGDSTLEKLASLKPAFKPDGIVTAGNASGINDGAAMLLLCDEATAARLGRRPLAYLGAGVQVGCDPTIMGIGPAIALQRLVARHGLKLAALDRIEINEAFAAQALACLRELGLADDEPRVNVHGGGVALGHPVGASGARLAVHLAHQIASGHARRTVASLCVGGGMGIASLITEKPQ